MKPRVLIISDRLEQVENACVLVGTMGCSWMLSSSVEDALANCDTDKLSAVVVDLPNAISDPVRMEQNLAELLGRVHGRLVVLTEETVDPEIASLESKYSISLVRRNRVMVDLWPCLATLMSPQTAFHRIWQVARLVLDTFLQPQPVGIRASHGNIRQLVYEAEHFTTDISFEHPADSTVTTAVGQIMLDTGARVPLIGVPVVLNGEKGPIGLKMTNRSGEFSFEFENARQVTFEIEVDPGHWIALVSPVLEWDKAARAYAG